MKKIFLMVFLLLTNINTLSSNAMTPDEALATLEHIHVYRESQGNTVTTGKSAANISINYETNTVSISCDNGAAQNDIPLSPDQIQQIVNNLPPEKYDVTVIPPPPPLPVVTSSSASVWGCSSYISSWTTTWSTCNVEWVWSANGSIQCRQKPSYSANTSSCWSQVCTTTYVDGVASGTSCGPCTWCPGNAPKPNFWDKIKAVSVSLNAPTSNCNNIYANNSDSCKVTLRMSSPTEQNRWIAWTASTRNITDIVDKSWEKSDRIWHTGNALNFSSIPNTIQIPTSTTNNFIIDITWIKSRTPFVSNNGKIWLKLWGVQINDITNISYHFKKPFTGAIEVWDEIKNNWSGMTTLWTENRYKLYLIQKSPSLTLNSLAWYKMNDFSNQIQEYWDDIEIQSKSVNNSTLESKVGTEFSARINTSIWATKLNQNPWLQVNLPIVEYTLWWEKVRYYISEKDLWNDTTAIKTVWSEFMWVRVVWWIQWGWKSEFTWQQANISNLYNTEQRTIIRKNAYDYVKSMKSWEVLNGVKYVNGNITISWYQNYETLVVTNWNVIINDNLNVDKKTFWIIVLKDGYNIDNDFNTSGNIYITPNVTQINAIIYADGWIISANTSWTPYLQDSIQRTQDLKQQLILNGSVFTRNTIWGAILAGWDYVLPGWSKTSDFNKAMIYDLNYIRRGSDWCDKNGNNNCTDTWEYTDPFVIIYDSRVQVNPPKLFSK